MAVGGKRPGAGAPSKIHDAQVRAKILSAIRAGSYIETACAFAGITRKIFYEWLKRGARATTGIHREFSNDVQKALAEAELLHLRNISEAAKKEWQAAAWYLERRYPDRWGRRQAVDISASDGSLGRSLKDWLLSKKENDEDNSNG
jgi:hypothetical protein